MDTLYYLLELLKKPRLYQVLVRTWINWKSHTLRTQYGMATFATCSSVLYEVEHTLTCDSAISFLGIYWREMRTYIHMKTCMHTFIVVLFRNTKNREQLKCFSAGKQMKKTPNTLWYLLTMEYHAAVGTNKPVTHAEMWMNLKIIGLTK